MKIFLIGPHSKDTALRLKQKGLEIVYWVIRNEDRLKELSEDKKNFSDVIFHSSFDAAKALPAQGLENFKLNPSPGPIFDAMLKYEPQTLLMMERVDHENFSIMQKNDLYFEYITYWHNALLYFKPDAILFSDVPHNGFNFVIYQLARILKIKTVILKLAKGVQDGIIFFEDYEDYASSKVAEEYQKIKNSDFKLENLSPAMQEYYQKQVALQQDFSLHYDRKTIKQVHGKAKNCEVLPRFDAIKTNLKRRSFLKTTYAWLRMFFGTSRIFALGQQNFKGWQLKKMYFDWRHQRKKFQREYERLQTEVDFSKNFVYFPLHLQPECSTNPLGGIFSNQILIIKILSAALPSGWVIYVKENPAQWIAPQGHLGRYEGYYQQIAQLPNVYLVPATTSSYRLIAGCQVLATVNGTAGWEAVLSQKPVIIFARIWYRDCEGIFEVFDTESCRAAFEKIKNGFKPSEQGVMKFLGALEKVMIRGYPGKRYGQFSKISEEENSRRIADAFYQELLDK